MPLTQKLFAFCGIGDHFSFECTTQPYQNHIIKRKRFQDHYKYHNNESQLLKSLQILYKQSGLTGILTTEKDFVKIKALSGIFFNLVLSGKVIFFCSGN